MMTQFTLVDRTYCDKETTIKRVRKNVDADHNKFPKLRIPVPKLKMIREHDKHFLYTKKKRNNNNNAGNQTLYESSIKNHRKRQHNKIVLLPTNLHTTRYTKCNVFIL